MLMGIMNIWQAKFLKVCLVIEPEFPSCMSPGHYSVDTLRQRLPAHSASVCSAQARTAGLGGLAPGWVYCPHWPPLPALQGPSLRVFSGRVPCCRPS